MSAVKRLRVMWFLCLAILTLVNVFLGRLIGDDVRNMAFILLILAAAISFVVVLGIDNRGSNRRSLAEHAEDVQRAMEAEEKYKHSEAELGARSATVNTSHESECTGTMPKLLPCAAFCAVMGVCACSRSLVCPADQRLDDSSRPCRRLRFQVAVEPTRHFPQHVANRLLRTGRHVPGRAARP
jgi:hypothetical protein